MDSLDVKGLREALQANPDFVARTEEDLISDVRLKRFLMGRGGDVQKAKEMYEDHLKWRKEHNIEKIRAEVMNKPYLVSSFPHSDYLKQIGMGMHHVIVNGGRSRLGEVVHIECFGGTKHIEIPEGKDDELVNHLFEHYYGFFERRSLYLEELSKIEKRMIRGVQIRDMSQVSIMPQGGVFSVIRKILKSGLDNYPESASHVLFVNPPAIFSAIYAIIKRWLPDDTRKKIKFVSGETLPEEMMKVFFPAQIVAHQRSLQGELGDVLSQELNSDSSSATFSQSLDKVVSARDSGHFYFALSKTGTQTIAWKREDEGESMKSKVYAKLYVVRSDQEKGVPPDAVEVQVTVTKDGVNSVSLPSTASSALVVLILDHTSSWLKSHHFRIKVEGK